MGSYPIHMEGPILDQAIPTLPYITASTMTLARYLAKREVQWRWRAQGIRIWDYEASDLAKAAKAYLSEHPELIEQAAETVRNVVRNRTLPDPQTHKHKANSTMTNPTLTPVNRTLPRRLPNSAYRQREYLTEKEVERLIEATRKRGRNGPRDACAILLAYRHGLRAQELCSLRWSQIDLRNGRLHVNRAKGGQESVHPLHGPELRALRPLQGSSPYVFMTEAGSPVTTAWFLRMVQRTGKAANLPFQVHPHMLRHSTGYKLANQGEDTRSLAHYLGHRNLQSTARYTALALDRFAKFWKD
jgi:type 1 fimbriae regulatory protein FimE